MLNFTPFARPYFARIAKSMRRDTGADALQHSQRRTLQNLIAAAASTRMGSRHNFKALKSYEDFAAEVPVTDYEPIRSDVMLMVQGQPDILWPGVCRRFAQSSGTSGGKSKYIPLTDRALARNHYFGASHAVAAYLDLYPDSRLFSGKSFILGGSYANEIADLPKNVCVGDLSASLIDRINPVVNLFRVPSKEIALMPDWTEKLPALALAAVNRNITNISGVPSWFYTVLIKIMELKGADNIHQVWPNLEVFFHGGIAFGPYRKQYQAITDTSKMRYIENYNASEGFFAVQDTLEGNGVMRLLTDVDCFYEFLPLQGDSKPLPAWDVEPGECYALIITASNGLWRHLIGDTVRIESTEPLRISIAGRTNSYINAFGEELMVWNADAAIESTCRITGAAVANYTAAPVYAQGKNKGHHQWLIEWTKEPAEGAEFFADVLDAELQKVNSDYQAKRSGDIFLDRLSITTVPAGTFDRWLATTGKLGGQRKIPRLSNDRKIIDQILAQ